MPVLDPVAAFTKAVANWNPEKHPRDRVGQFIEVGDLVNAFSGPGVAEPEATGMVTASYFDKPTGRIFIGVTYGGYTKWYRPKQIEHLGVKAKLNLGEQKLPEVPIPAVDDKYDEVFWTGEMIPKLTTDQIDNAHQKDLGGKIFSVLKKDLPDDVVTEMGLTPQPPLEPTFEGQPTSSAPKIATGEHDKVLSLVKTSFYNKGLELTYPGGSVAFESDFQSMLDEKELGQALLRLAKLMTAAKLGGKQRARYKSVLVQKYGGAQSISIAKGTVDPSGANTPMKINPKDSSTWREFQTSPPPGTTSLAKGNSLITADTVGPAGGWAGAEAGLTKGRIQTQLAERLMGDKSITTKMLTDFFDPAKNPGHNGGSSNVLPFIQYPNHQHGNTLLKDSNGSWGIAGPHHPNGVEATPDNIRRALLEDMCNVLVSNWAASSNDSNPRSLAMQLAARDEFKLKGTYDWNTNVIETETIYKNHQKVMRKFLRAMYDNTQKWAADRGITHVRLRRGSEAYAGPVNSDVGVKFRPMSSFSTNTSTAQSFGSHVVDTVVPVEWIVGTCKSGYGCLNEYEWVVLGGTHKVKVVS